jgi:hypothetical protein
MPGGAPAAGHAVASLDVMIAETFFLTEIKRSIRTQKFRDHGQEAAPKQTRPLSGVGLFGPSMTGIDHAYAL